MQVVLLPPSVSYTISKTLILYMERVVIRKFYCMLTLFADLNILQMSPPMKTLFKNQGVDGCYFGIKQFSNFS